MFTGALDQPNIVDLGPCLEGALRALDLHGLGDADGVPVLQEIADGILDDGLAHLIVSNSGIPLMAALGTNQQCIELIDVLTGTAGAGWQSIRHLVNFSEPITVLSNHSVIEL